jgi:hypothetical protein
MLWPSSLSSPCQRIQACLTSCEASQGRTSFLRILFSAAATAVNLQRGLIRQVPFLSFLSTLQTFETTTALLACYYFFLLSFHFPHTRHPGLPTLLSLSLTDSSWTLSKGCVRAIKNFPFSFIASLNISDKAQQREGERERREVLWLDW